MSALHTIVIATWSLGSAYAASPEPESVDDVDAPTDPTDDEGAEQRPVEEEFRDVEPAPSAVTPDPAHEQAVADLRANVRELKTRVEELEDANDELQVEREIEAEERYEQQEREAEKRKFAVAVHGYLDVGLFWAQGNGSGVRSDLGHDDFPEFNAVPDAWVFVGDPLSTAVNARGEPADTGPSRAIAFDSVDSRGKSTFLVNAFNLQVDANLGRQVSVHGMVDFVPRSRDISSTQGTFLGDFVDFKLGFLRWRVPVERFDLMFDVGKVDSVFGREYRIQESPYRTEVTPSLLCRYTCGRPVGIKTRMRFLQRRLSVAASVTNGSSYQESFAFYNEVDRNQFKTITGRLAYEIPVGAGLEFGASGQYGAQDLQTDDLVSQWQYGFDAHLDVRGLEVTAEFVNGRANGKGQAAPGLARCSLAPCLRVIGTYGTVGYRVLNWLMPFVRVDWREALHQSGNDFVYVSQIVRFSPGVRFDLTSHLVFKAQYTANFEIERVPAFPNDIMSTSLVGYF